MCPANPLAICLLASEVEPLSKTGGLADVAGALTKYAGTSPDTTCGCSPPPTPASIAPHAPRAPLRRLTKLPLDDRRRSRYVFSVLRGKLPGGAPVYLIDCPALYARAALYTSDPDEHVRFLGFTRAALHRLRAHALGAAASCIATTGTRRSRRCSCARCVQASRCFARGRTLLTIHNIGYQGIFAATRVADLGLAPQALALLDPQDLRAGRINALRHGILYADAISTVSPTHAREICSDEYGMGLQDSLRCAPRSERCPGS